MEECRPTFLCHCKRTCSTRSPEIPPLNHGWNTSGETRPQVSPLEPTNLTCRHGDLVFAFYDDLKVNGSANTAHVNGATLSGDVPMSETTEPSSSSPVTLSSPPATQKRSRGPVKQDAVDDFLDTQDGKIPRKRDPKMCKHGEKGMCDYCMPLEVKPPPPQTIFLAPHPTNL